MGGFASFFVEAHKSNLKREVNTMWTACNDGVKGFTFRAAATAFGSHAWCRRLRALILVFTANLIVGGCGHGSIHHKTPEAYKLDNILSESVVSTKVSIEHDVYFFPGPSRQAPPILLLHELPGLSPNTLYFAEALSKDFNVYVPLLFGSPNQENTFLGTLASLFSAEWAERTALQGSRPITVWASTTLDWISTHHPGQPVGVIGMCLTGAMPLSLLDHKEIKAIVVAQPTLPIFGEDYDLGISAQEWEIAKRRASTGDIHVYGVRFEYDTIAKRAKHERLKKELGEKVFLDREISAQEYCHKDADGNYTNCPDSHSTLTYGWLPSFLPDHPMNVRRSEVRDFFKTWLVQAKEEKGQ
jgi:dienelactone hydrolase